MLDQDLGDRRAPFIGGKHASEALGETNVVDERLELLVRIDDPLAAALLTVVDRVIPKVLPDLGLPLVEAQRPAVVPAQQRLNLGHRHLRRHIALGRYSATASAKSG